MKIVIAPQYFKGSLSALGVAGAIEQGVKRIVASADTTLVPMADGGEGTVEALVSATRGELRTTEVTGPLGDRISARWGLLGDGKTAAIEMAAASGLPLVPTERLNPCIATTYGTGELILAALNAGCRKLIIGIGGSATNDGGAGMAHALGVRFLDASGQELPWGGAALADLAHIDISALDHRLSACEVVVACDVTNPLCGPTGASLVYGPQKGASPETATRLDAALAHYAEVIERDLGINIIDRSGAGAAGGLGAGLIAFLDAKLVPGIDIVCQAVGLAERLKTADLVFTGEGRLDEQTIFGKTIVGVAKRAKQFNLPVVAIVGGVQEDYGLIYEHGVDVVLPIAPGPASLAEMTVRAEELIADAAERAMRLIMLATKYNLETDE